MAPFYGWGSTTSRLEPLRGSSLLLTTKFPEIPGTHFIDLGRMKGWVDLGATQWFVLFVLSSYFCCSADDNINNCTKLLSILVLQGTPDTIIAGQTQLTASLEDKISESLSSFISFALMSEVKILLVACPRFRDNLQISLLILREYQRIDYLLPPVKSSENLGFSDDFRGNRS